MNEEAIAKEFDRPIPRKVCRKRDSPEEGVGFNPWSFFEGIGSCGGLILGAFLLLALIPDFRQTALIAAAIFVAAISVLSILAAGGAATDSAQHKRLAQYGEAVIGRVLRIDSRDIDDGTPAPPTQVTVEYQFCTRAGQELTCKKETISGWYDALVRERDALVRDRKLVVIYLPDDPETNEPYNSLAYRVCG